MKLRFLIITLICVIFFYGCEKKTQDDKQNSNLKEDNQTAMIEQDYTAPFLLNLQNKKLLSMQKNEDGFKIENNDKAILFTFFTTWCPPCKAEIPHLNEIQDMFKDNLMVIGVLMEEKTQEEVNEFIKQNNINYEISSGESNFFFGNAIGGINGVPYTILYDKNGKYISRYLGLVPREMLISDINKVLL
ncbi:TlpA family protein disulfide reductase [Campylobacter sputorum]|uniref:TlpA family protein disulfide reductase n=1 Tax=Campylobacter sputorum TaxID=206 RepID=UPI000B79975A|nr:TlpA disulfide reductase family protein [Campylobacter sputorum]ASM36816.1 protein disulfide reductase, TlpA family [Campylobacter sputorum bv. faecalis CCUG 20703]